MIAIQSDLIGSRAVRAVGIVGMGAGLACVGGCAYLVFRRGSRGFAGKAVLITGGSRGLGMALAEEFGRRGARLALVARHREELESARQQLVERGAADEDCVLVIAADLRRQEEAERAIREAVQHFGHIDVLVNNAGIITVGPVEHQTAEDFREVMNSNFFTGLYCTLAAMPEMLKRGEGAIANVTSIGGKIAVPHLLPYTASKFAAVGFSEGLNAELRSKGILVTTVVPGLMRTGSHRNALFTGDAPREYRWFSLGATMPGASASARHAARKIVTAIAAGDSEITITPQAFVVSRLSHVLPELTHTLMQGVNRILPKARQGQTDKYPGRDVAQKEPLPARTIGRRAAERYNQMHRAAS